MKISATGYGAGDHEFPEHANVLRVIVGEPSGADEAVAVCDKVLANPQLHPQIKQVALSIKAAASKK